MQGESTCSCCTVAGYRPTSVLFAMFSTTYWGTWMRELSEQKINQHFGSLFFCSEELILTQCLSCSWKKIYNPSGYNFVSSFAENKAKYCPISFICSISSLALVLPPMFEPSYLFEIYLISTSKCKIVKT